MQEDFLHYIWKFRKFCSPKLKTSRGKALSIVSAGIHNFNSGPDFLNAIIIVDSIKWAGNIELHINSSDWLIHNHQNDPSYESVILHAVWNHDKEIKRLDGSVIPVLELKKYVSKEVFTSYHNFVHYKQKWIPCETHLRSINDFIKNKWIERLFFERLESKTNAVFSVFENTRQDWEATFFKLLLKNFGLKINQDSFLSIAESIPFSTFRTLFNDLNYFEAMLYGQAKLLDRSIDNNYYLKLKADYQFLKNKFRVKYQANINVLFFRLRPNSFPTIRLSQFANLYAKHSSLFSKVLECKSLDDYYNLFDIQASAYWTTHSNFGNPSPKQPKKLSRAFIDKIIINSVIPTKFAYGKLSGESFNEEIYRVVCSLKSESNKIISRFKSAGLLSRTAIDSQALLQLNKFYCEKRKCLNCAIGIDIISK